jgi:translation initiation factor 2 subunit 1
LSYILTVRSLIDFLNLFWCSIIVSFRKSIGYIDLSKRRVSPEDITKCEERFMKARTVSSIMRHVASRLPTFDPDAEGNGGRSGGADTTTTPARSKKGKDQGKHGDATADEPLPPPSAAVGPTEEERLEKLYEHIAWPLGRKYGNVYDAFKLVLTQVPFLFPLPRTQFLIIFVPSAENQMPFLPRSRNLYHKRLIAS